MKRTLIKVAIVLSVFFLTILITSSLVNLDSEDLTREMDSASLPVISIEYEGIKINPMYGFVQDMDLSFMRNSITPLMSGRKMHILIDSYEQNISAIDYELRTVSGNRLIESTSVNDFIKERNIDFEIVIKDLIEIDQEYEFIIFLTMEDGTKARYYTRLVNPEEYYVAEKLSYVEDFSQKTFNKDEAEELIMYLESNSKGDNSSFGYVNINSSFKQVTWGDLEPQKISDTMITIKELAPSTGSFLVNYYVSTDIDDELRYYKVEEFFRIRYTKDRIYLLDYERTMDEIFTDEKSSYNGNRIELGINSDEIDMTESEDGNNIAFIANNRLYVYNIAENKIAYLYGYYENFTSDIRELHEESKIKVMNVDEAGNVTFLVYGYMNRGTYEGMSGVAAYYYNSNVNSIEEMLYIPSSYSPDLLITQINKLSYMNSDGTLYMLAGNTLYAIDSKDRSVGKIADDLTEGSYEISDNNHIVCWQQGGNKVDSQSLVLLNLETGKSKTLYAEEGDSIYPLDFIGEDLIYGKAHKEDICKDKTGGLLVPMYLICIANETEGVIVTYEREDVFVTDAVVNKNQISLSRVKRMSDGSFADTTDDQIMNSEDKSPSRNLLGNYTTETYEKQYCIELKKDINASSMKHLNPKQVQYEGSRQIQLKNDNDVRYVVYGRYGVENLYYDVAQAVDKAYNISGIVMNAEGEYIYKKTARSAKNQIMAIKHASSDEQRSSLAICLDTMLEYENVIRNSQYMLSMGDSVMEILESALVDYEILDLGGCKLDTVLYYIDRDIPVMVLLEGNDEAVMITGFNDHEVVIMNPHREELYKISISDAEEWFDENGNYFITYLTRSS